MQSKGRDFAEYFYFTQKRRLFGGILKESDKNNCNLRRFPGRICSFQGAVSVYGRMGKMVPGREAAKRGWPGAKAPEWIPARLSATSRCRSLGLLPEGEVSPCPGGHTPPQSALAYAPTGPPEELIQAGLRQMFFSGYATPGWVPLARRVGNAYAVIHDRVMGGWV